MPKQIERHLFSRLNQALAAPHLLQRLQTSKKALLAIVREEDWRARLSRLAQQPGRYRCAAVLCEAESTMARLSPLPEQGWLRFCYQFAADTLYPDTAFAAARQRHGDAAWFFLALLQLLFDEERQRLPFDWQLDFIYLTPEESAAYDSGAEYQRLLQAWREDYVYELLRLTGEVMPYHTLAHIAGVHHLALSVAQGLQAAGVPVEVPLAAGAAMTHDLGKYGCRPGERVPYLHYYYTERWCREHGLNAVGHIAANHSTWDLELELLQAEALLLIYADFRVREIADADGVIEMMLLSLKDAFDAVLQKLDNVDEAKLKRYEFVYAKLHDFEDYVLRLGVDIDARGRAAAPQPLPDTALMDEAQVTAALKFLSVDHNVALMHRLGSERLFGNILEAARSEQQWKNVRAYLNIFEQYSDYLSAAQKVHTLGFLYELLMHREGDIRRAAAALVGKIIARFHQGYAKELPAHAQPEAAAVSPLALWQRYLQQVIIPDHKLSAQHKSWIGYTLKIIVPALLQNCREDERAPYLAALLRYFYEPREYSTMTTFVLCDVMCYVPLDLCGELERIRLAKFAREAAQASAMELRVAALRLLRRLAESAPRAGAHYRHLCEFALSFDDAGVTALIFLKGRLLRALGLDDGPQQRKLEEGDIVADIFLDNLKTATPWMIKAVNIKVLLDQIERGKTTHLLHIAAHFSNLIKVSERVVVRHDAGAALLKIAPLLTLEQRNEIAVELTKGLEVGEYEFSKYIPDYLGRFALYLHPDELDEMLASLGNLLGGINERVISVALSTVGVILQDYPSYRARFAEPVAVYARREEKLLGMLLKGLAGHQDTVRQEALLVLGQGLFGNAALAAAQKSRLFALLSKKMLFLLRENPEDELTFYYSAAALNHIYRFIAAELKPGMPLDGGQRRKIAFFPGTFDPFTLSHKGIVQEIRDLGFEVLLAIDEFSWSKKTQPRLIRRQIASMSLADEFHVHIFADSIPVNLANADDLQRLAQALPGKEIYIVVGSDVVANASSYRQPPTAHSIHGWNHIVFRRAATPQWQPSEHADALKRISGRLIELQLPLHLEDISSTRIRENIDSNRDISHLIDPAAQEFIYSNSLYLREPQYKPVLRARAIHFEMLRRPRAEVLEGLLRQLLPADSPLAAIAHTLAEQGGRLLVMRVGEAATRLAGILALRELSSSDLYAELRDLRLTELVRARASGRILLVSGIAVAAAAPANTAQLLLAEAIAAALSNDCTYAMFHPAHALLNSAAAQDTLERQGFARAGGGHGLYVVDMGEPLVLLQNLETAIKEPLVAQPTVQTALQTAHERLQRALTGLYPGQLVLSLSSSIIHHRLMEKITALNGVPLQPSTPRRLGPLMCVPFGKMLRGKVVPNTVTKTLHTDKVYAPDIRSSSIEAYPYYAPLPNQIRTIKSFMRPAILVDDLLHGGDRMLALDPLFREEQLDIRMVLVGLLSGHGRDLMAVKGYQVDGVYYTPNLKQWFVEATLYPFIGGDTVRRAGPPLAGLLPSVNLLLPYATPPFAGDCPGQAVFDFSLTCLENARDIFLTLEAAYRAGFERNLTLSRLSEAVILPLCPDKGSCMSYDPNLPASAYLENDMEMLLRSREVIVGGTVVAREL